MVDIKFLKLILVVDDTPASLTAIKNVLVPVNHYRVFTAKSADDALRSLERNVIDLILLDIEMPGKTGFDVFEDIRKDEFYSQTPIFFVTGTATPEFITRAVSMGARDYVVKPVNADILLKKVDSVFTVSNSVYIDLLVRLKIVEKEVSRGDFIQASLLIERLQGENYITSVSLIMKRIYTLLHNKDRQNTLRQLKELTNTIRGLQA